MHRRATMQRRASVKDWLKKRETERGAASTVESARRPRELATAEDVDV